MQVSTLFEVVKKIPKITANQQFIFNCYRCRLKCFQHFTKSERQSFLTKLNLFATKDLQDTFLQGLLEVHNIVRCRPCVNKKSDKPSIQRNASCKYYVLAGDTTRVQVSLVLIFMPTMKQDSNNVFFLIRFV